MHISLPTLALALTTIIPPALSAICYPATSTPGKNCASKSSIKDFYSVQYCNFRWDTLYGDWDYFASANASEVVRASVGKTGTFESIEACLDGFKDVVETCHGVSQGGVLVQEGGNVSLNVHFCDW
ncbi:hypothetical protein BO71DRAFT_159088 [Aspergillus ellipticus CBS 707.79]|uniref:Ecp2 effector protein domain-containing protein n=1 Tax=Aspergillus ellipticus CBS 707.79 TaxID=1448320 RepID=A0A319CTV8_9EURO|nr:hypothetical protein BO71DRAFT_159088 [Aspergillus ellipticus CBS 707.79]